MKRLRTTPSYLVRLTLALIVMGAGLIVTSLIPQSNAQVSSHTAFAFRKLATFSTCSSGSVAFDSTNSLFKGCTATNTVKTFATTGAVTSSGFTMSTNKLLGRSTASTGAVEEITLGTNLSFSGTTLNASGGPTINATDGVIPYRSSATAFSDSPLTRVDANIVKIQNGTNVGRLDVYGNGPIVSLFSSSTDTAIVANSGATGQLSLRSQDYVTFYIGGGQKAYFDGSNLNLQSIGLVGATAISGGSIRGTAVAFASLPASPVEGMLVAVTDSNTATWGATIAGGGANHVLAYYNGTNWTVAAK